MRNENGESNDITQERQTPGTAPPGDRIEQTSVRPGVPQAAGANRRTGGMLPGVAGISIYMLLMAMINAFAAARGQFGAGTPRLSILGICSLIVLGVFGVLRLRRWGWALMTAGCLLIATGYFYGFHLTHIVPYLLQGAFALIFFLYLVRPEVRERMR